MASATLTESEWKKWIAAFSGGKRQVDKLITAFVDGFYPKTRKALGFSPGMDSAGDVVGRT
jgi:hypothetical protein